jgi:hypothetical protein
MPLRSQNVAGKQYIREKYEIYVRFWSGNLKEKGYWKNLDIDGRRVSIEQDG